MQRIGEEVNHVARRITTALERAGIRALNPSMAFPMEADRRMTERMPSSVDPEIRQPAYALALSAKTSAKV